MSAGHLELVRLLLEAGANVNIRNTVGATPLHIAAQDADEESLEMVELLLSYSAHRLAKTIDKKTPAQSTDCLPVRAYIGQPRKVAIPKLQTLAIRAVWKHHLSGQIHRLPEDIQAVVVRNIVPRTTV